jgi:hypothetical protein
MAEQRKDGQRREDDRKALEKLNLKMEEIHHRVYNGLGQELRQEVGKELSGMRRLVIGILIALLLSLAGIIVEGRTSSTTASQENLRNYKAIVDLEMKLDYHLQQTERAGR